MTNFNLNNKVTGEKVIGILHAGEYVLDKRGYKHYFKQGDDSTLYVEIGGIEIPSQATYNDVTQGDWFLDKEFDPRKAMFERPNEWVAKYTTFGKWYYIGFDIDEMVAIQTDDMKNEVDYNDDNVDLVHSYGIKNAVALDKEDLKFLANYKNK